MKNNIKDLTSGKEKLVKYAVIQVSISKNIDSKIIEDSKERGLNVSANISRILYDYFEDQTKITQYGKKLPVTRNK